MLKHVSASLIPLNTYVSPSPAKEEGKITSLATCGRGNEGEGYSSAACRFRPFPLQGTDFCLRQALALLGLRRLKIFQINFEGHANGAEVIIDDGSGRFYVAVGEDDCSEIPTVAGGTQPPLARTAVIGVRV